LIADTLDVLRACSTSCGEAQSKSVVKWTLNPRYRAAGGRRYPVIDVDREGSGESDVWDLS
jgi:hypothetical protein